MHTCSRQYLDAKHDSSVSLCRKMRLREKYLRVEYPSLGLFSTFCAILVIYWTGKVTALQTESKLGDCGFSYPHIFPNYFDAPELFFEWARNRLRWPSDRLSLEPHLPGGNLIVLTFSNGVSRWENVYKLLYLIDTTPYTVVNIFSHQYHARLFGENSVPSPAKLVKELPNSIELFVDGLLELWQEYNTENSAAEADKRLPYILYIDGYDNLFGGCSTYPHIYLASVEETASSKELDESEKAGLKVRTDLYASTQMNLWPWVYGEKSRVPGNPRDMAREGSHKNYPGGHWVLQKTIDRIQAGTDRAEDFCPSDNEKISISSRADLVHRRGIHPSMLATNNCPLPVENRFFLATVDEDDGIPDGLDTNRFVNAVFCGKPRALRDSLRVTNDMPKFVDDRWDESGSLWWAAERINREKIEMQLGNKENYQMIREWYLKREAVNKTFFDFGANVMWNFYARQYPGGFTNEVKLLKTQERKVLHSRSFKKDVCFMHFPNRPGKKEMLWLYGWLKRWTADRAENGLARQISVAYDDALSTRHVDRLGASESKLQIVHDPVGHTTQMAVVEKLQPQVFEILPKEPSQPFLNVYLFTRDLLPGSHSDPSSGPRISVDIVLALPPIPLMKVNPSEEDADSAAQTDKLCEPWDLRFSFKIVNGSSTGRETVYEVDYVRIDKVMVWEERRAENSFMTRTETVGNHRDDGVRMLGADVTQYRLMTATTMLSPEIPDGIKAGSTLAVNLKCIKEDRKVGMLFMRKKPYDINQADGDRSPDSATLCNFLQNFGSVVNETPSFSAGHGVFEQEIEKAMGVLLEAQLGSDEGRPQRGYGMENSPYREDQTFLLGSQANQMRKFVSDAWARDCHWPQTDSAAIGIGNMRPSIAVTYATEIWN